jgi:hypothetical protein
MSSNRLKFDKCAYNKDLAQSTSSLNYTLDPSKWYNCSPCRNELGLLGGNTVSLTRDNMVDLESDLFNMTRQNSRCPERKFLPQCDDCDDTSSGMPCGSAQCKAVEKAKLKHLPECNLIQYAPRIDHVGYDLKFPGCPTVGPTSADGQEMVNPPQFNPVRWKGQPQKYRDVDSDKLGRLHQFDSRTTLIESSEEY